MLLVIYNGRISSIWYDDVDDDDDIGYYDISYDVDANEDDDDVTGTDYYDQYFSLLYHHHNH